MKAMGLGMNYAEFEDGAVYELKSMNLSVENLDVTTLGGSKTETIQGRRTITFVIDGEVEEPKEGKAKIVYEGFPGMGKIWIDCYLDNRTLELLCDLEFQP